MTNLFLKCFPFQLAAGRNYLDRRETEVHDRDLAVGGSAEDERRVVVSYYVVLPMVVHWLVQYYSSEGEDEDAPDNSLEENRTVREVL